jgi:hypothetical protein
MTISAQLMAQSVTRIPAPKFIPMEADRVGLGGKTDPVLAETSFKMNPGDTWRVFGRVDIVSSTDGSPLAQGYTECTGPDGFVSQRGDTNQNHGGKNASGPSYPFPGELSLYPSLLIKATQAGMYTCRLSAVGNNDLAVVGRDYDGLSTTWLMVSAEADIGGGWWQNLPCDEWGDPSPSASHQYAPSSCLYLDGATNQKEIYIFQDDGSPQHLWEAAKDAAFVDASGSLLLTTCHYDTSSCTSDNTEGWWNYIFENPGGTWVRSHLELLQVEPDGEVCHTTQSRDQITKVGNTPHHYEIYHSMRDVPIYPCNGSRTFRLRLFLKYLSGNPVKIDGSSYGPDASTFTHAYAINSSYSPDGAAPPVPNLIGLNEDQARESITESGYAVSTVSSSLSTAPAGTVISQNPTNGVINYPGTGVEFTVSTGGATVPNLLSLSERSAISEINALGLVPSVSFSKACINPGDVLTQSPLSGTVVSTGSTVHITVDSGTYKTCILK